MRRRGPAAAIAAGFVLVAATVGVVTVTAAPSHPAATTARSATAGAGPSSCVPPRAGTLRLPRIDGRVPVVVHIPPNPVAGAPLILGLPGSGQTASDFARYTGYSHLADRAGFFVAYPTASGRPSWNISDQRGRPDDVAYLRKVIGAALAKTCARRGVGATGVSNGGGMAARLACDAADLVVAAAPVAGGYGSLPDCRPSRPVPVLEIHGTDDRVVPYRGKGPARFGAVSRFLAQWRHLDRCPARARRRYPRRGVTELRWSPCAASTAVVHDRITDAEHGWPGENATVSRSQFSSTARTWSFLSGYVR